MALSPAFLLKTPFDFLVFNLRQVNCCCANTIYKGTLRHLNCWLFSYLQSIFPFLQRSSNGLIIFTRLFLLTCRVSLCSSYSKLSIKIFWKVFPLSMLNEYCYSDTRSYFSVSFFDRWCLNQAKIKLPKQAEAIARSSMGKSFFKNISNCPAKSTLSSKKKNTGPAIHNPQRQDSFGQRKPNMPPPNRKIRARVIGLCQQLMDKKPKNYR